MNRDEFIKQLEGTFKKCMDLVILKNKDYANATNPFKNFELSQMVGVSVPKAILVRTVDKIARVSNLLEKSEINVKGEKIEDTLIDCINYLNILLVYLQNNDSTPII